MPSVSPQRILRAAEYARQSVLEDQGISQQVADLDREAARRGWVVVAQFIDNDVSGSYERGEGTGWKSMLDAYDRGEFDVLLVTETSRLTRRLSDVLDITQPRRDMRVVVIREGVDTAVDDFLLKQLTLLAEREVKLKAQRAARYAIERRAAGHPTSGMTPHGYRWLPAGLRDEDGARYRIDESEAADVRRIFDEFLAGAPLAQIARDLTNDGRTTRQGSRWLSSTVRRILLNPHYAALLPPAQARGKHKLSAIDLEECSPGAWDPIVTREQLVATRSRLLGVAPLHSGTARRWLLSGLALCSLCRAPVRSAAGETHPTARKTGGAAPTKRFHAYRCVNGHFLRNGDPVDDYVRELVIERLSRHDARDLLAKPAEIDIAALNTRRQALEDAGAVVTDLIMRGKLLAKDAEARLDAARAELAIIDAQLAAAVMADPLADAVASKDVREWWEGATLARQRGVVDRLMTVAIRPVGKGRRITAPEQVVPTVEITWKGETSRSLP